MKRVKVPSALPPIGVDPVTAFERVTGRKLRFEELDQCVFTYVMVCEGFLKIGRATHLTRRLSTVQTGCPFEVRLVGFIAEDIESETHKRLGMSGIKRVRGEWFQDTEYARDILWAVGLLEYEED